MLQNTAIRSPIAAVRTRQPWLPEDRERQDAELFPKSRFRDVEKPKTCKQRSQVASVRANTVRTVR